MNDLSFKNYKSYRQCDLKIKPFTLLLGANSTGKSALINMIMMLYQTIHSDKSLSGSLKINGDYSSMGDIKNIFFFQDINKDIELEFDLGQVNLTTICHPTVVKLLDDLETFKNTLRTIDESLNNKTLRKNYEKIIENDYFDSKASRNYIAYVRKNYDQLKEELEKVAKKHAESKNDDILKLNKFSENSYLEKLESIKHFQYDEIMDFISLILPISKSGTNHCSLKYNLKYNSIHKKIVTQSISLIGDDKTIFSLSLEKNGKEEIASYFLPVSHYKKYRNAFHKTIDLSKPFSQIFSDNLVSEHKNKYCSYMYSILNKFNDLLEKQFEFNSINHISPLRAYPKRYYHMGANISSSTPFGILDGENLTEMLQDDVELKDKVNYWLSSYGLEVDVEELSELIHQLKIKQGKLPLDITDVGFGISQVLPIIIQGFLAEQDSLSIIEQPEIHLHPKMQADLADLFIDIIQQDKKNILVETHSEYLLKRLRTRIAEGKINHNDVAIYYLEKDDNGESKLVDVKLDEDGVFKWPKGFYETGFEDTLNYAKAMAKRASSTNNQVDAS